MALHSSSETDTQSIGKMCMAEQKLNVSLQAKNYLCFWNIYKLENVHWACVWRMFFLFIIFTNVKIENWIESNGQEVCCCFYFFFVINLVFDLDVINIKALWLYKTTILKCIIAIAVFMHHTKHKTQKKLKSGKKMKQNHGNS